MKVVKIYGVYHDASLGRWFVTVMIKIGSLCRYKTIYRDTEQEARSIKEGDVL